MSAQPVKHFELYFDGHKCLAVHRLDELLQVTFTHGPTDLAPDVVFLAPTAAAALADAIATAARDAAAVFKATHGAPPPPRKRLPAWGPAFAFGGLPYTLCPAGDGRIGPGQSTRAETATGRLWHDDCAEDAGATASPATASPAPASAPPGGRVRDASSGGADGAAGERACDAPRRAAPRQEVRA